MNTISITIAGRAGSGKSTIAQAIARTLSFHHGIDVVVNDEDGSSNNWDSDRIESCLDSLVDRTSITITTQQSCRAAKEQ